jgi:hypothetical protein
MSWWEETDWISSDEWEFTSYETRGTTPGMRWVMNTVTKDSGLFKPESRRKQSTYNEYAASKIAEVLKIPSAKVLVGKLFDLPGCISMDVRKGYSESIIIADSLLRFGELLNLKESRGEKMVYGSPVEMSFQGLLPYLSVEAELGLVKMMFFDCITGNPGRHESNYMFSVDNRRTISGLLPLYDHGLCFQELGYLHDFSSILGIEIGSTSGDDFRGWWRGGGSGRGMRGGGRGLIWRGSSFPYYGPGGFFSNFPFDELFGHMQRDYPELINTLTAIINSEEFREVATKLECYDFIVERVNRFEER